MPSTKYPNSGIYGGWNRGENGWGYEMNKNLLLTDALLHAVVKSKIKKIPDTVKLGDLYLIDTTGLSSDLSNKENHLILFKSGDKTNYIDIPPQTGNKIYLVTDNKTYVYRSNAWIADLATDLSDSDPLKGASSKLTYDLNNKINNNYKTLTDLINALDKDVDDKYADLLDKISGNDASSTLNDNLNNLITGGKYFVHVVKGTTKNPPIDVTSDWWVQVSVYGSGTNRRILQEAIMHSTSTSNATTGSSHFLSRCCSNTTWGPWQYHYTQFAG